MKIVILCVLLALFISTLLDVIGDLVTAFSSNCRNQIIDEYLKTKEELSQWLSRNAICDFFKDMLLLFINLIAVIAMFKAIF